MQLLGSLRKPEYLFRPSQILRRLGRELATPHTFEDVMLPWGLQLRVRPAETIGGCIWRVGIYDVCASECLWRLLEPAETALDVGANIGHMTGLLARRAGPFGRVFAVEPHPALFAELGDNLNRWRGSSGLASVQALELALSSRPGPIQLNMPAGFSSNRGLATLEPLVDAAGGSCEVKGTTLDALLAGLGPIGVMKVDVEGHELDVLEGGRRMLSKGLVRDILFEEHAAPPTPVTRWLADRGYAVFLLEPGLLGPRLRPVDARRSGVRIDAPNCLASRAPERACRLLGALGWKVLGAGARRQR